MMEPTETQRKRLKRWIAKWRPRLFLHEWNIELYYTNNTVTDCSANVESDPAYMTASIYIHPGFWEQRLKVQEHDIVHELAHCISEESYRLTMELINDRNVTMRNVGDVRERLTQRIANLAFREEW